MVLFSGLTRHIVHSPARIRLRKTSVDIQVVRPERRRLYQPQRTVGNSTSYPRADGTATAPARGRSKVSRPGA